MRKSMKIAAVALALMPTLAAAQDTAPKLVTILTAAEPQTQLMAMVLTSNAVAQGAEAKVLLCGPAADIALRDAPESATAGQPPKDASPQGLLMKMVADAGVSAQVCAIYLPGRGEGPEVLMEGVTAAAPDAMAAELIAPDTTVLSF